MSLQRQHMALASELGAAFDRVVGASAFILGEEVERFENQFAAYCGTRHCIGVGSGTAALTIMLQAGGIGRGDEVIVPAHTFLATALSVRHVGARPVCVDVRAGSGLIDSTAVETAIGPATAAILPVHLYGQPCPMGELQAIAQRHGLALFEDAAQAHGASYQDVRAGALGNAAAFSFYPSKNLGALGDGGAICTDDDALAASARRLRDLGRDREGVHSMAGYNERLDGLQAAFLRVKLPHLDRWNASRRGLAAVYEEHLTDVIAPLAREPGAEAVYHLFPIRLERRDEVLEYLRGRGISVGVHYDRALPDQPALAGMNGADVPVARDWAATELSLPMFPELRSEEQRRVIEAIRDFVSSS